MKALSVFGIVFGLITLGTGIYTMNINCNCAESADSLFQFNNETNDRISGSGWAMVFSGIFFLVFSIITSIVFFNSKTPSVTGNTAAQPQSAANWPAQNQQQRQQYQQPQGYGNWPPQNYQQTGYPPQNYPWQPPAQTPPPPIQNTPPPQQQWTPPPPPVQTPPPVQNTPPPTSWQQPPADDVNRWAPKRDDNPTTTPPEN